MIDKDGVGCGACDQQQWSRALSHMVTEQAQVGDLTRRTSKLLAMY